MYIFTIFQRWVWFWRARRTWSAACWPSSPSSPSSSSIPSSRMSSEKSVSRTSIFFASIAVIRWKLYQIFLSCFFLLCITFIFSVNISVSNLINIFWLWIVNTYIFWTRFCIFFTVDYIHCCSLRKGVNKKIDLLVDMSPKLWPPPPQPPLGDKSLIFPRFWNISLEPVLRQGWQYKKRDLIKKIFRHAAYFHIFSEKSELLLEGGGMMIGDSPLKSRVFVTPSL